MLCTLAVRLLDTQGRGEGHCVLRISGETALGPSGTGGRDEKIFATEDELLAMLQALHVPESVLIQAESILEKESPRENFEVVARGVQIAYEDLERCDFYLFDP